MSKIVADWDSNQHETWTLTHTQMHTLLWNTKGAASIPVNKPLMTSQTTPNILLLFSLFHLETLNSTQIKTHILTVDKEWPQMWTDGLWPLLCIGELEVCTVHYWFINLHKQFRHKSMWENPSKPISPVNKLNWFACRFYDSSMKLNS